MNVNVVFRSIYGKLVSVKVEDVENTVDSINESIDVVKEHASSQNLEPASPMLALIQGGRA